MRGGGGPGYLLSSQSSILLAAVGVSAKAMIAKPDLTQ